MSIGRQPITIVEIDLPTCVNTFGTAPCTAVLSASVPEKCFNTRASCASVPNFNGTGTQTLRFAKNQSGLPKGQTIFPALQTVSTNPAELNLSGIDPSTSALGKRARVTVNLLDFPYSDTLTDPYQAERVSGAAQFSGAGYQPMAKGTFFGKLIARQPYYIGKPLRVLQGYVGDALAAMSTAHYVISEWRGPDASGAVQITAKDILDLADNTKAVCPAASNGKALAAITAIDTVVTLTPTGIGDAEYPASGRVCIGREVMTFTRTADVLTLTARGMDGTTATTHAVNDVVQTCYHLGGRRLSGAIQDLLVNFANVPAAFITIADWHAEEDAWLGGMEVSVTITKPQGVAGLVGEICQLGVMVWWDEIAQQIRFRCNRPLAPGESIAPITDAANILRDSAAIDRADDQRISALYFWHGMLDPTDTASDGKNFAKLVVATVGTDLYGQDAFKTIYNRWFGSSGDDAAAAAIALRLLGRYQETPKQITMSLDVKDSPDVSLGGLITVSSYLLQDATGASNPEQMQINKIEFANDRINIAAQTYSISGRFAFWLQDVQNPYGTASTAEKAFGAFWMDDTIGTFADGSGPYVYF